MSEFEIANLSESQEKLLTEYGHQLFLAAYAFVFDGKNEGKELEMEELKAYADEQCPEGAALVKEIIGSKIFSTP